MTPATTTARDGDAPSDVTTDTALVKDQGYLDSLMASVRVKGSQGSEMSDLLDENHEPFPRDPDAPHPGQTRFHPSGGIGHPRARNILAGITATMRRAKNPQVNSVASTPSAPTINAEPPANANSASNTLVITAHAAIAPMPMPAQPPQNRATNTAGPPPASACCVLPPKFSAPPPHTNASAVLPPLHRSARSSPTRSLPTTRRAQRPTVCRSELWYAQSPHVLGSQPPMENPQQTGRVSRPSSPSAA